MYMAILYCTMAVLHLLNYVHGYTTLYNGCTTFTQLCTWLYYIVQWLYYIYSLLYMAILHGTVAVIYLLCTIAILYLSGNYVKRLYMENDYALCCYVQWLDYVTLYNGYFCKMTMYFFFFKLKSVY